GLRQRVVAGVGPADREPGDLDGLARAHARVAERAGGAARAERRGVAGLDAVQGGRTGVQRGVRGAVVALVARRDAGDGDLLFGDARRGGWLGERVVARIGTA